MKTKELIRRQRYLNVILIIEIVLLLFLLFLYGYTLFPELYRTKFFRKYFNPTNIAYYTDDNKQLRGFYLQTLAKPILKSEAILLWAQDATIAVNTLSSSNYENQLNSAFKQYFTDKGAQSLLSAYQARGTIDEIVAKKLSVTAVVQKPPVLLGSTQLLGRTLWKIQLPILITYESLSDIKVDKQLVTLTMTSVPTTENPQGIAVDQYQSKKR